MNKTDESVGKKVAVNSKRSPARKLLPIIIGTFIIILGVSMAISFFSMAPELIRNISKYGIYPGLVGQIIGFFLGLFISYIFITYGYKKIKGKKVKDDTDV